MAQYFPALRESNAFCYFCSKTEQCCKRHGSNQVRFGSHREFRLDLRWWSRRRNSQGSPQSTHCSVQRCFSCDLCSNMNASGSLSPMGTARGWRSCCRPIYCVWAVPLPESYCCKREIDWKRSPSTYVHSWYRLFQEACSILFIVGVGNGRSGKVTRGDQNLETVCLRPLLMNNMTINFGFLLPWKS